MNGIARELSVAQDIASRRLVPIRVARPPRASATFFFHRLNQWIEDQKSEKKKLQDPQNQGIETEISDEPDQV